MFSNNNAVSVVISVVLLLGLVMSVITLINVYYVPSWIKDDEASHMRSVFVDFSAVSGDIEDLVLANETDATRRKRIELGGGNLPIVSSGKSWGTLGVGSEGNFTVSADVMVGNVTGKSRSSDLGGGYVDITNVSGVSSFYIDLNRIQNTSGGYPTDFQKIIINFTGQSGKVEILITPVGSPFVSLRISTWNSNGDKIIDKMYINSSVETLTSVNYKIDLLSPCYGFNKVLNDATPPYNLTITNSTGIDGTHTRYNITYTEYNRTIEHYSMTSSGILMYESRNRHFIDQKFVYQNGAIFLCQPPNASMRIGSDITITAGEGYTRVTIPLISINATEYGIPMISGSGVEELQMRLDYMNRSQFADGHNTDNVTIMIEPPDGDEDFRKNYLGEWENHLEELVLGTLVQPASNYASNYTSVNITLNGTIHLELQNTGIEGRIASISS